MKIRKVPAAISCYTIGIMLKNVILYLSEWNSIPHMQEFLQELTQNDVMVYVIREERAAALPVDTAILITDQMAGVRYAQRIGTGYLIYETQENRTLSFPEAECVLQTLEGIDYEFLNHMYERTKGISWTILETKRCIVREIRVEDLKRLYEIYEAPSITAYMEGLYPDPKDEEEFTRAYIKNMYGFYGFGLWIVEERRSGLVIGRAGISIRDGFDNLELGYLIAENFQRKGYAEEVCRAVIQYAHDYLGCEKLNAFIDARNTASVRLAEKLGFCHIGQNIIEQKTLERYQLLYENFTKT